MVWPLGNNGVAACGLNLGWKSMSRTGCMRGVSDFVRRSLATHSGGISARHATTMPIRWNASGIGAGRLGPCTSSTRRGAGRLQQLAHAVRFELRIAGVNGDEEAIGRGTQESLLLQQRID